jgi:hypothetical protein
LKVVAKDLDPEYGIPADLRFRRSEVVAKDLEKALAKIFCDYHKSP